MSTPKNAPYKIRQEQAREIERTRGVFIPSGVQVEWSRQTKRFITWNRAARRDLERAILRRNRQKLRRAGS